MSGAATRAAAGLVPAAAFQSAHPAAPDSVVVESPLPGGVAQVVRFLLNTVPQWVQIGGAILAVVVGIALVVLLVRRRRRIVEWISTRRTGVRIAVISAAVLLVAAAAATGTATWNYTQHSNDFCTGCHVMEPAFTRFASTENKHDSLSCHACHQQSLYASARQVYLWVAERPEKIAAHAKVPNRVCESCHVTGDSAVWQRIASTAGHRVHLESDSSALRDVQCVTCHGVDLHRFVPASETCGQSGCHSPAQTDIELGKMAQQTSFHCTACHDFTAEVPALATRDSARGTLVPGEEQCLGCHQMQAVLPDFDPARDPHGGKCGTCHNPHEQQLPRQAAQSCTSSGCHADWRTEPFHVGPNHQRVGEQCLTCHVPHAARVDASDCQGCHLRVRERTRLTPPLPFDTAGAMRRGAGAGATAADAAAARPPMRRYNPHVARRARATARTRRAEPALVRLARLERPRLTSGTERPPGAPADSFPHARHAKLACLVCHQTAPGRGRLTFDRPRGCLICHHEANRQTACASCHQPAELATALPETLTVAVRGHAPRPRAVTFSHETHTGRACRDCHTAAVTLAPAPAVTACRSCHEEHHAAGRACASCHAGVSPAAAHPTLRIAHQRCDACHAGATVERLTPTRSFCITCHTSQAQSHYEPRECSSCHFLAPPDSLRRQLTSPVPA